MYVCMYVYKFIDVCVSEWWVNVYNYGVLYIYIFEI